MDDTKTAILITNVLKKGIMPHRLQLKEFSESHNESLEYFYNDVDKDALKKLVDYLKVERDIASTFDETMVNTGNGASRLTIESLVKWLVITSHLCGVKEAIRKLNVYLGLDHSPALAILAISGIKPSEHIFISDTMVLIPFEDLPTSRPKETLDPPFLKSELLEQFGFMPFSTFGGFRPPKAALVKKVGISPKIYKDDYSLVSSVNYLELYEACEFLTLFSDATPVPIGTWSEFENSVPCKQFLGSSWSSPSPDVLSSKDLEFNTSDWENFKDLYEKFSHMSQNNRDLLRIPIQRINQSRRRKNYADKAIDQGVAFEALFLNDKSHKDQISFIFRLRASLLLGDTIEQRQDLMNFFTGFYSCRSLAVHTGKLDKKINIPSRGKVETGELLKESDHLCIRAITKIIINGEFPIWNNLLLSVGLSE